jgi:RNA polymerase sigma-70 factor (ECF subfamily)
MLYLATSLVGQKIADEVVQEAWFSSLKAINKFEKRSSLKIWLPENEVS